MNSALVVLFFVRVGKLKITMCCDKQAVVMIRSGKGSWTTRSFIRQVIHVKSSIEVNMSSSARRCQKNSKHYLQMFLLVVDLLSKESILELAQCADMLSQSVMRFSWS